MGRRPVPAWVISPRTPAESAQAVVYLHGRLRRVRRDLLLLQVAGAACAVLVVTFLLLLVVRP